MIASIAAAARSWPSANTACSRTLAFASFSAAASGSTARASRSWPRPNAACSRTSALGVLQRGDERLEHARVAHLDERRASPSRARPCRCPSALPSARSPCADPGVPSASRRSCPGSSSARLRTSCARRRRLRRRCPPRPRRRCRPRFPRRCADAGPTALPIADRAATAAAPMPRPIPPWMPP